MTRNRIQTILALLLLGSCLIISGCYNWRPFSETELPPENGPDAGSILIECRRMVVLPREEQAQLYQRLRTCFEQQEDAESRFGLVCLALQPGRTNQDRVRARQLLRDYLHQEDPREDLEALATVLESLINQRLNVEQRLATERKRADELAAKLKALEDIERIIRQREEGGLSAP